MKLDREIRTFFEQYDREVMECIDALSSDFGVGIQKLGTQGFNIVESIDLFNQYLHGYMEYKINNRDNAEATDQPTILESVQTFLDTKLFQEQFLPYKEASNTIKSYLEGMEKLSKDVTAIQERMMEEDVDQSSIGDVQTIADRFSEAFHKRFDPVMEHLVQASGYTSRQKLLQGKNREPVSSVPVFL